VKPPPVVAAGQGVVQRGTRRGVHAPYAVKCFQRRCVGRRAQVCRRQRCSGRQQARQTVTGLPTELSAETTL